MDGTLVDTEPFWIETEFAMAHKYGATWSHQDALHLVGSDLLDSARYLIARMSLERTPEQVVEELLDGVVARIEEHVPWRPGARELLAELQQAGVPCALVTMSWQRFVAPVLAALPPGTFAAVVTGDQVSRGKPHPEPYLAGAAALGLAPTECVAIEDSGTGAASAEAAGCRVLVVENHVSVPAGPGRVFRDTLTALGPADLGALAAED